MTTTSLAPEDAARQACATLNLPTRGLTPVRAHATSVYALPAAKAIVRVSRADQHEHITRAVTLTRWLDDHDIPVTQPLDVPQPVTVHAYTVSFWHHYPQPDDAPTPHPEHLAGIPPPSPRPAATALRTADVRAAVLPADHGPRQHIALPGRPGLAARPRRDAAGDVRRTGLPAGPRH
ncbi:hypothetical protein ACFWY6_09075 [Streptomyces sp. NPDC059037]|uniref:hypothetical protein n=1 Tax=Streptomyces sp. NPDC059037 TaxID=3346710 RepID=UPI0036ADEFC2